MNRTDAKNRRIAERLPHREEASVQIMMQDDDGGFRPTVAQSVTLDVSIHGFRLLMPEALPPGHIYDVCLDLIQEPKRFLLTGETRWCRESNGQAGYEIGVEILPGEGTDFEIWADYFRTGELVDLKRSR